MIPYGIYDKTTGEIEVNGIISATALFRTRAELPEGKGIIHSRPINPETDLVHENHHGQAIIVKKTEAELEAWRAKRRPPVRVEAETLTADQVVEALKTVGLVVPRSAFRTPAPTESAGSGSPS